jgi:hypothetical protein
LRRRERDVESLRSCAYHRLTNHGATREQVVELLGRPDGAVRPDRIGEGLKVSRAFIRGT